jgi:DNA-binding MarR family transcriptional regulator
MMPTARPDQSSAARQQLESVLAADVRALTAESDHIGRVFADLHHVAQNDLRALLHVFVAETQGRALTSGQLSQRMGLSGAAVTYLVDRMIDSGHLHRVSDPADRRKVILRYSQHGKTVARAFFTPLRAHMHTTLAGMPDRDLRAAHRVLTALTQAMRVFEQDLAGAAPS